MQRDSSGPKSVSGEQRQTKVIFIAFYPSDWLSGTRELAAVETGVYITLIAMMYERGAPLRADYNRLALACHLPTKSFKKIIVALADEGKIVVTADGLWNERVEKELIRAGEKSLKAKQSAQARWKPGNQEATDVIQQSDGSKKVGTISEKLNEINETEMRSQCGRNANQNQNQNQNIGGDGSASAREIHPTFREKILEAVGCDPVSGLTGHGGRQIGTSSDMALANHWITDLDLSVVEVVGVITDVVAAKTDGPPQSFKYFTPAMERMAGAKRLQLVPCGKGTARPTAQGIDLDAAFEGFNYDGSPKI